MSLRGVPICAVLGAVLVLGLTKEDPEVESVQPDAPPRVAATVSISPSPDTLRASTTPGTPLVRSLPAEIDGAPVTRYLVLRGPALSGVAGRSFTWIAEDADPGTYDVRLQAEHADAPADTLVLRIELES